MRTTGIAQRQKRLLEYCAIPRTIGDIMAFLSIGSLYTLDRNYIKPMLSAGLLRMVGESGGILQRSYVRCTV